MPLSSLPRIPTVSIIICILWRYMVSEISAFRTSTDFGRRRHFSTHPTSTVVSTQLSSASKELSRQQLQQDSYWSNFVQSSPEIQEIRQELVTNYVRKVAGCSYEEAQKQVDDFLSDPEQSYTFIEMKKNAKAPDGLTDDLLTVGVYLAVALAHTILGLTYFLDWK